MRRFVVGLLAIGMGALAACSSNGSSTAPPTSAATSTTAPISGGVTSTTARGGAPGALTGTLWSLRSVGTKTIPANVDVTATFANGTVGGSSGCNSYSGPYEVTGSRITIGAITTTEMACPPPQMPIERTYLAALAKVQPFEIGADGSLTLALPDNGTLVYVKQEQTLVGSWHVTGYLQHAGNAFTPVLAGTTVTARFDTLDKVTGSSGCNTYGGPYVVKGSTVAMGPFGSTLMACAGARQTQESDFLAAMGASKTFKRSGGTLTFFDAQQRRSVTMQRAPGS